MLLLATMSVRIAMTSSIDGERPLSPAEYEAFVADVVSHLEFGATASVTRNAKLPGVRQPGEYEIDVLVRTRLGGKIDFLMTIECKNWSRAVDRPVVQKAIQTRDAVAAHKAAVVSPVGFSAEAIDVAKANGIALWVLSRAGWSVVMGVRGPSEERRHGYEQRKAFLRQLGIVAAGRTSALSGTSLVQFEAVRPDSSPATAHVSFLHRAHRGSAVLPADDEPGVDPRLALSELADDYARALGLTVVPGCRG
jgi:hypothetical protein